MSAPTIIQPVMSQAVLGVGKLLEGQALTTGKNTLAHGLGRAPVGVSPYHSDSSGYASGYAYAGKSGDLVLPNANAWNTITSWNETDPYSCFSGGVVTFPRSGIYTVEASVCFNAVADGAPLAVRLYYSGNDAAAPYWAPGAAGAFRQHVLWTASFARNATLTLQAYRATAAQSVVAATGANETTHISVIPHLGVDAYSWDDTNIYVHSDYAHTRSFWIW